MMRVDGAWKAVRDPRGPIWPSATSIQGFQSGFDAPACLCLLATWIFLLGHLC
jgi:hypothetical protein